MRRILILSDNTFLRELIRLALNDIQAEVRCVADAERMQALCRCVLFDLVIVVGVAPFLAGGDLVRAIRPPGLRRPRIYVLSRQHAEQTILGLLECGVDQYMTLPVNLQRLRAKVSGELESVL